MQSEMNRCSCDMQAKPMCICILCAHKIYIPFEFKLKNSAFVCNCKPKSGGGEGVKRAAKIKIMIFIWYCFLAVLKKCGNVLLEQCKLNCRFFFCCWNRGEKNTYSHSFSLPQHFKLNRWKQLILRMYCVAALFYSCKE